MNTNATTTTNKTLGDLLFTADLKTLENLLSYTGRIDIFSHFKILLSLIFDKTLKETLLKFFLSLTSYENKESVELKAKALACHIEKLFKSSTAKSADHLMDAYVGLECNYLILLSLIKNLNKRHSSESASTEKLPYTAIATGNKPYTNQYQSIFFYTDKNDEETISKDICSLINLNDYFQKHLITFIKYLKYYNTLIRSKEYFSTFPMLENKLSELLGNKLSISNLEYFLDLIFFSTKYLLTPNSSSLQSELNINIENFKSITFDFFTVFFEYLMINYKSYEKMINDKLSNLPDFENYLTLCYLINTTVTDVKLFPDSEEKSSSNSSFFIDFNTFYPAFNDYFVEFFFNGLKYKIISKLNDLIHIYENKINQLSSFDNSQFQSIYFPPYLLNLAKDSMSELLVSHFIALNVNENNFEVDNKGYWLKNIIQCFCFADVTEKFYKIIIECMQKLESYNRIEFKKNGSKGNFNFKNLISESDEFSLKFQITEIFSKALENYKIIFPRRLMMLKELYTLTYLILVNYFVIKIPGLRDNTYWNKSFFEAIEEFKKMQNKIFFILCSSIEEIIIKENYRKKLRIYGLSVYPFDYIDIFQEKKKIKIYSQNFNFSQNSQHEIREISSAKKTHENSILLKRNIGVTNFQLPGVNNENQSMNISSNNSINNFSNPMPMFNSSILSKKPASTSRNEIFSQSKSKKRKSSQGKLKAIKFDITSLFKDYNLNPQQFKLLENKSEKNISVSTNSNGNNSTGNFSLKIKMKSFPSCFVLTQKNNFLDLNDEISFNTIYSSNNPDSQSFNFLKEFLSCELLPKLESDGLISMEVIDYDLISFTNSNLSPSVEKFSNCLGNLKNTFKYYDLNDKLKYEEVVENMIKLLQ
jgi:hypothetical protein